MNTTPNKTISPISSTDKNGVEWTFDAATGRWNALVAGKKISSKDFSLLKTKVDDARIHAGDNQGPDASRTGRKAGAEAKAIEVAMVRVEYETLQGGNVNHAKVSLQPVVAKMEWDPESGQMKLIRYKEKGRQGESGWRTHRADGMLLIHPQFLTAEMRHFLEASAKSKLVGQAYRNACQQIAGDWWAIKEDFTQSWSVEHKKGLVAGKAGSSHYDESRQAHASSQWTMSISQENMDYSAWKRTEEGHLAQGDVQVRMITTDHFTPYFGVYVNGEDKPLFKDTELDLVMQLAQATHSIRNQPGNIVAQWHGSKGWERAKGGGLSWPKAYSVHGGAVAIVPRDRYSTMSQSMPQAYMLAAREHDREWKPDSHPGRDDALANLQWRKTNDFYGACVFCQAGAEDGVLDLLKQLRKDLMQVSEKLALAPITAEALKQACADTVRDVCGAIEDGEELVGDIAQMEPMIERLLANAKHVAERDETVKSWQQACTDTVDAARKQLAKAARPEPGSQSRRNAPR